VLPLITLSKTLLRIGKPHRIEKFCLQRGLHLLTYGAEPFLRSCRLCSHSGTSPHFKEPEGSSPCSQEPSTGPYPEPDPSSSYHPILSLSLRSILILSTYLRLCLPSGLFPSSFPTNIRHSFLFSPFVLHSMPISSSMT
jgi:hypothetical protein